MPERASYPFGYSRISTLQDFERWRKQRLALRCRCCDWQNKRL